MLFFILLFAPLAASIFAYYIGYKVLALWLVLFVFLWNITMLVRNNWLYKQYLQLFIKEAYKKDQFDYQNQYDALLLKVWIINVRKYIDKTVECSMKK